MANHTRNLYIIVTFLAIWILFLSFKSLPDKNSVENEAVNQRVTKVEFFQEATRIRDNVVGFKQVDASLPSKSERKKNCDNAKDLLIEWTGDLKKVSIDFSDYMNANKEAKNYFDDIISMQESNVTSCNELSSL